MKATIIGGRGFIGSHLAKKLESMGTSVTIPEKDDPLLFDTNLGTVFYCAGITSDFRQRPFDTINAHVTLLANILEKATFSKLIYLSSTRVYYHNKVGKENSLISVNPFHSDDLFNLSKLTGEALCLMGIRPGVKVVRLSNVCGEDDESNNFIYSIIDDALKKGHIELRSSLDSEKDYVHIKDVVDLILLIAEYGSKQIYNIASGVNISNGMIIDIIEKMTGCSISLVDNPETYKYPTIDISSIVSEFSYQPLAPQLWLEEFISKRISNRGLKK